MATIAASGHSRESEVRTVKHSKRFYTLMTWLINTIFWALVISLVISIARGEGTTMYAISRDSSVNVRLSPSTKSDIGGYLDFGWDVTVLDERKDSSGTLWYKVDGITEMGYGWVCANYLIPDKPTRTSDTYTVSASGRVAVYNRVEGKRKAWVKPGQKLRVTIYSDSWCLTEKGYIRTEYLEKEGGQK